MRAVIRSTTPGMFAAGADLREVLERRADGALRLINIDLFERLERNRWPTIAEVDGPALGAVASERWRVTSASGPPQYGSDSPRPPWGIVEGPDGNWRLSHLLGPALARLMLYLGEFVDAIAALDCGLMDRLVDTFLEAALENDGDDRQALVARAGAHNDGARSAPSHHHRVRRRGAGRCLRGERQHLRIRSIPQRRSSKEASRADA